MWLSMLLLHVPGIKQCGRYSEKKSCHKGDGCILITLIKIPQAMLVFEPLISLYGKLLHISSGKQNNSVSLVDPFLCNIFISLAIFLFFMLCPIGNM